MQLRSIRPIGADTLADLSGLLGTPPEGTCWCVAWEVADWQGWSQRTAAQNRTLREALWQAGEYHGFVFYLDGAAIGWCRVGPASVWPKLVHERRIDEVSSHAFTCFGLAPAYCRQGHTHHFLDLVLAALRAAEVRRALAAPKRLATDGPDGKAWNGPAGLFQRAGFVPVHETAQYQRVARTL